MAKPKLQLAGAAGFEPANAGTKSNCWYISAANQNNRDPQKSADFDRLTDD
jgi:hypothetical protein